MTESLSIDVAALRIGMHVQLEQGWMRQPFLLSSLRLASEEQLATLRGLGFGLATVKIVPARSDAEALQLDAAVPAGSAGPLIGAAIRGLKRSDEFVVLLNQTDARGAETIARRVLEVLAEPFALDGLAFSVTGSIGIAMYPTDGASMTDLIKNADAAMYRVKARGRAGLRCYQPPVDLASGAVLGAEALLRWRDVDLGDIAPGEFIPVAEESGFIVALGDWVLAAAALPAALLELELTESILIQDADEALQRLRALDRLGVRLANDDFGTGYSSLGYLKRFPIKKLKIDRSFIKGLPGDASDAGIAQAVSRWRARCA